LHIHIKFLKDEYQIIYIGKMNRFLPGRSARAAPEADGTLAEATKETPSLAAAGGGGAWSVEGGGVAGSCGGGASASGSGSGLAVHGVVALVSGARRGGRELKRMTMMRRRSWSDGVPASFLWRWAQARSGPFGSSGPCPWLLAGDSDFSFVRAVNIAWRRSACRVS
jgi:hypothetical protein